MKKYLTLLFLLPTTAFAADLTPIARVPDWAKTRPCLARFEMDKTKNLGRPVLRVRCAIYKGVEVLDKDGNSLYVEERKQ